MTHIKEKKEDSVQFSWGKKKGNVTKEGAQFYESLIYDGMEYCLFDCVYLFKDGELHPFIGKIIKIWEKPINCKKVKILWFFRPSEIHNYLGEITPLENEVFLACGEGKGLFNINPVEVLGGKCTVVCTSKDKRNPQPSNEEVQVADYIFYRTFDVGKYIISDKFDDKIAGAEAKNLFNRKEQVLGDFSRNDTCGIDEKNVMDRSIGESPKEKKAFAFGSKSSYYEPRSRPDKQFPKSRPDKHYDLPERRTSRNLVLNEKQIKLSAGSLPTGKESRGTSDRKIDSSHVEVTERPVDRSKWFADLPWDVKMANAYDSNKLVLLDNLDPGYAAVEVEEILSRALGSNCNVRLIERSAFTNIHHGQALAVFKSEEAATSAIQRLRKEILLLPNRRPLLATRNILRPPGNKTSALFGHLSLDKISKLKRRQPEMRKAASSSHYSQANTIEYRLAMEWMLLDTQSKCWWEELQKENLKEIEKTSSRFVIKSKLNEPL